MEVSVCVCVCIFVYIYLYSLLYIEKEREPYPSYTLFQTSVTALFQTVCGKSRLLSSPLDSAPSNRLSTFRAAPHLHERAIGEQLVRTGLVGDRANAQRPEEKAQEFGTVVVWVFF